MSDELRLPDDLAACEARLAAMALPAATIDRDDLMYRAGWAAGAETARLAVVNPPPSKGGARGGIRLAAASLTSAAVAASLATWITLQSLPDSGQIAVDPLPSDAETILVAETAQPSTVTAASIEPPSRGTRRLPTIDVGLLALRRDALARNGSMSEKVASSYGDLPTAAAKTARELLDELLPPEAAEYAPSWPWRKNLAGDSI